ncbi:isocitrate lyase/phosphoenolpyruvate mutase family protein [Streptomyces armeniacus]|uniref:Isocitrate lyase/phosphoenolpyruvate mutase family protein n=1 Tax=Streptomyces armeniacus TaxID=83291 RepID=A0A345XTJ0_9ACTN|nr:isocitrate lyase/phosphoenolpyruvate mutase family protein [Streptomyces armeniacus]AXK34956.1 isocitrate lyase/phosphoenolpyruvate mutase family protein [Streptomyces armeniacus]
MNAPGADGRTGPGAGPRTDAAAGAPPAETPPAEPPLAAAFRTLHLRGRPLLLPNAWDRASAVALCRSGFPAVGTTSLGVAAAAGLPDGTGAARAETLALARGLARLPVPVSVDIEGGFGDEPADVADFAARLARAGVAGINIEDGRPDGTLADPALQCARISAVKEAAPGLFVNARTDTHWLAADPTVPAALRRAHAYVAAGADGVFVPALTAEEDIAALAGELEAPLNVLFAPGRHTYERLAELGVRRVSCGSLLFRAAVRHAVDLARSVLRPGAEPGPLPGYAEARSWAEDSAPPDR